MKPKYDGDTITVDEWPQPMCEIKDIRSHETVHIRTAKDAEAIIESLTRFIEYINQYTNIETQ